MSEIKFVIGGKNRRLPYTSNHEFIYHSFDRPGKRILKHQVFSIEFTIPPGYQVSQIILEKI